jgi:transcriptional regulator with XRE-family HTH domain
LADYVKWVRTTLGLTQKELATKAGVRLQSVERIERGITTKLNRHSRNGLAYALQIPVEYSEAMNCGIPIPRSTYLKFCPRPQLKKQLWGGELWSDGYFASTVGKHGDEGMIATYVKNQGNEYLQLHRDEQLTLLITLIPRLLAG